MLRRVGWSFAVVSVIYGAQVLIRGFALWRTNLARQLRYRDVLLIRLATEALELLTLTGPLVAEPAKGWLLTRRGLDGAVAYGAVLTEFLLYTVVSAVLAIVALALLITRHTLPPAIERGAWVLVGLTLAFLAAFLFAAATGVGVIVPILRAVGALLRWRRVTLAAVEFGRVEDRIITVLRNRAQLAELVAIETMAHTLLVAEVWVLIRALGFSASWLGALIVEGGSKFVGIAFAFIPGQFGASEEVYAVLARAIGLSTAVGLSVALLRRLRGFGVALTGLIVLTLSGHPTDTGATS